MFGVHFHQSNPTTYVMRYKNGQLVDFGLGLTLLYFGPTSTVIFIDQTSQEVPFVFQQRTLDFQEVTIQGHLTFRIVAPERLARLLDFSVDQRGRYMSEDPNKLPKRIVRLLQSQTHKFTRDQPLIDMLSASDHLAQHLTKDAKILSTASLLGLEIESIVILSIRADPEMTAAMRADARERLLRRADEASHERRKYALELDRELRENEWKTERAMQEQRREVRHAELESDVAIEDQRAELATRQARNEAKLAEIRMETARLAAEALRGVDWRTLVASAGNTDSKRLIALAFAELAENAAKIGRLDITPDLLSRLIDDEASESS